MNAIKWKLAASLLVCLLATASWAVTNTFIVTVGITFVPLHTYFMAATGCSDANTGTSAGSPWCSPNHPVVCGDVIIAAAGNYNGDLTTFGTVSGCPSVTGGIDGAGGIEAAVLLCGGSDLTACTIDCAVAACNVAGGFGPDTGIAVGKNNWSVQGWRITCNTVRFCVAMQVFGCTSVTTKVSFINNFVFDNGQGFEPNDCGHSGVTTADADYVAIVGNIVQNSVQINFVNDGICIAAIDAVVPGKADADTTHTHWLIYNNYIFNNLVPGCDNKFDGENIMLDTIDNRGVVGRYIIANNIGYYAERSCVQLTYGGGTATNPLIKIYQNSCTQNGQRDTAFAGGSNGDLTITTNPWSVQVFNNIFYEPYGTNPQVGSDTVYAEVVNPSSPLQIGAQVRTGAENIMRGTPSPANDCLTGGGASCGTNTSQNPNFKNLSDLITNHLGVPNCTGMINTTKCMGWDGSTNVVAALSVIDDLTASCAGCAGKGFQLPGNCVNSGDIFTDFPTWLKGLVYLHWTGSQVVQMPGLATVPCGM